MICPECNGRGKAIYYVETDRDENTVTVEKREGICRTCNGSGEKPQTNADRIRAMTDEELAKLLYEIDGLGYCKNLPECGELLDAPGGIPEEKCIGCMLNWLRQPAEGGCDG